MAAASPSTVTYAVGCGEYISIDSAIDLTKDFGSTHCGQAARCTYDNDRRLFYLECGGEDGDACLSTLSDLIQDYVDNQTASENSGDYDTIDDGKDAFQVDAPLPVWEDVDEINQRELYGATRSSKEVKEDQFLETWQPADTQLDFLSFTKLWGDDLVEELSKLTGCVLQSSPERRQIQIAGKDRESAERSKGMLEILERHFLLQRQSISVYLVELGDLENAQLRFVSLNSPRNRLVRNSMIDHRIRSTNDLYVLRTVGQARSDSGWSVQSTTETIPLSPVPVSGAQEPSRQWKNFHFQEKGDETLNPINWADDSSPLLMDGNPDMNFDLDPNASAIRVERWVAERTPGEERLTALGLPSDLFIETDLQGHESSTTGGLETTWRQSDSRQDVPPKRVGKVRRPIVLRSQQAKPPSSQLPEAGDAQVQERDGVQGTVEETVPWGEGNVEAQRDPESISSHSQSKSARSAGQATNNIEDFFGNFRVSENPNTSLLDVSEEAETIIDVPKVPSLTPLVSVPPPGVKAKPVPQFNRMNSPKLSSTASSSSKGVLEPAIEEQLKATDETETRVYKRTMAQRKAPGSVKEVPKSPLLFEKLHGEIQGMLKLARPHRGQVSLRMELGKILAQGVSRQHTKPFAPDELETVFEEPNRASPTFTNMLTTSSVDADFISDLRSSAGRRIFEPVPQKEVTYQFKCTDTDGREMVVEVDGINSGYTVQKLPRTFGSALIFSPERTWDVRLFVEGTLLPSQASDAVKDMVSKIFVAPNQTTPSIATKVPKATDLRIHSIFCRRRTQHVVRRSGSSNPPDTPSSIALQITEVQDLIIQRYPTLKGALRAFATPPHEMITDSEGSRLWYEVELVSPAAQEVFKENHRLKLAEEASWVPEEVIDQELVKEMYDIVKDVLKGIDGLGIKVGHGGGPWQSAGGGGGVVGGLGDGSVVDDAAAMTNIIFDDDDERRLRNGQLVFW